MCIKNATAVVDDYSQQIRQIILDACQVFDSNRANTLDRLKFRKKIGNRKIYEMNNQDKLSVTVADVNSPETLVNQSAILRGKATEFLRTFKECDETQAPGEQCYNSSILDTIQGFIDFGQYLLSLSFSSLWSAYYGGRVFNLSLGVSVGLGSLGSGLAIPIGKADVESLRELKTVAERQCTEKIADTYSLAELTIQCSEKDNDKLEENQPEPEPEPEPISDLCISISNSLEIIAGKELTCPDIAVDFAPVLEAINSTETNLTNLINGLDFDCPEIDLNPVLVAIQNTQDFLDGKISNVQATVNIIESLSNQIKSDTNLIFEDTQYLITCPCNDDIVERLTDIINNIEQTEIDLDELKTFISNQHNNTVNTLSPNISGNIEMEACEDAEQYKLAYFEGIAGAWASSLQGLGVEGDTDVITQFLTNRLDTVFGKVFTPFNGYSNSYGGQGILGVSNQLQAVSGQINAISEQLCLDPEKLEASEAEPPQQCDVVVVEPFEKFAEFERVTQLAISYIPQGERRTSKTSRWSLNIPNPIANIDWCRDIEPLIWHKGNISLRIYWDNSKVFTGGYFRSENDIDAIIPKITRLSTSTPTNIRISKGGSPKRNYRDITVVPIVASRVEYNENSEKTGITCYKRPPEGC